LNNTDGRFSAHVAAGALAAAGAVVWLVSQTCIRLGRRCRRTATINAAIGLIWTIGIIALAALGLLGAVWVAILRNVGIFIVIANAGRLLRFDEDAIARPGASQSPRELRPL
jgi:cation transport ATPase